MSRPSSKNFLERAVHVGHAGTGQREMRFVRRAEAEEVQETIEALEHQGLVERARREKLLPVTAELPGAGRSPDVRNVGRDESRERTGPREGFARCAFVEDESHLRGCLP